MKTDEITADEVEQFPRDKREQLAEKHHVATEGMPDLALGVAVIDVAFPKKAHHFRDVPAWEAEKDLEGPSPRSSGDPDAGGRLTHRTKESVLNYLNAVLWYLYDRAFEGSTKVPPSADDYIKHVRIKPKEDAIDNSRSTVKDSAPMSTSPSSPTTLLTT